MTKLALVALVVALWWDRSPAVSYPVVVTVPVAVEVPENVGERSVIDLGKHATLVVDREAPTRLRVDWSGAAPPPIAALLDTLGKSTSCNWGTCQYGPHVKLTNHDTRTGRDYTLEIQ